MKARPVLVVLAALAVAACLSCSSENGGPGPPDTTPPTITSASPADGADDVGLIERVEITFSEPMDASTINDQTIAVEGRARGGHVSYDAAFRTAYVVPETLYVAESAYRIVVSDSVSDVAGNQLTAADTTSFETGVLDCAHLTDYLEPNDDEASAALVDVATTYPTLSECGDDMDFFLVDLADTTRIDFHITFRHAASQWSYLELMRGGFDEPYLTRWWHSTEAGSTDVVSFTFLPGTHRYCYNATVAPGEYILYDIELTTSEPCRDDAFEDNDWYQAAVPIAEGTYADLWSCPGDADWFEVDVEEGQTLTVTVTRDADPAERSMGIWLPDGTGITTVGTTDNPLVVDWTATETGTYRIDTRCWTDSEGYEMVVDVSD